ncbi:hypothetical protein ILYODFUR_012658 [Ilyodon furcidens]|uniref:Uncharacterized protein n=1 Tax=Ilyodon furcidens TaxID=33524 RepID=A0ABV0VDI0_9TELE
MFKLSYISTEGPKVCQETIHHTIIPPPPACASNTGQDGSMILFMQVSDTTISVFQLKFKISGLGNIFANCYCSSWVSLCKSEPQSPAFSWQDWYPVWFSAAIAHMLQSSTC